MTLTEPYLMHGRYLRSRIHVPDVTVITIHCAINICCIIHGAITVTIKFTAVL